jgi:hypothetical protein
MKSSIFLLFFTLISASAFAQLDYNYKHKPLSSLNKNSDINSKPKDHRPFGLKITEPEVMIENKMPVLKIESTEEFIGNNGKGFDIYLLKPGNMYCLKPNASHIKNMPVVGLAAKEKVKP